MQVKVDMGEWNVVVLTFLLEKRLEEMQLGCGRKGGYVLRRSIGLQAGATGRVLV